MIKPGTLQAAMLRFKGDAPAYIICSASEPDGKIGFAYRGDLHQLNLMLRYIRGTLREREGIGNLPNRKRDSQDRGNTP